MFNQKGQALIVMLVVISIVIMVVVASLTLITLNIQSSSDAFKSQTAYYAAESAAEETILGLLRDPQYGVTPLNYSIGAVQVRVSVIGNGNQKTIDSQAIYGSELRSIEIKGTYTDTFTITSWVQTE